MQSSDFSNSYDVIIIGAGAAGLMAAVECGKRGRRTLLLEHTTKIGEKIRISGGGRCNFTNIHTTPAQYLSDNPHFVRSALARYKPSDNISYHEKTLGQLFCDHSAQQIIQMFLDLAHQYHVEIKTQCTISELEKGADRKFYLKTSLGPFESQSLVIATGGLSIPQIGASDFGYKIAEQFNLNIIPPRPALVPLLLHEEELSALKGLSGLSAPAYVSFNKRVFLENILITHRGLSGPAILQISSYLEPESAPHTIQIDLLPYDNLEEFFKINRKSKKTPLSHLRTLLPNRLVDYFAERNSDLTRSITDLSNEALRKIVAQFKVFCLEIAGNEGYRKAEVTAGGLDTKELSSKTMEVIKVPGLYFIGEVVDVTGWLGGYNFQWAWASGFVAGQFA
ncbi:MAG: NAD(P)/FAD-dependent oxidoreductase [Gammaproteobacteria bacterium]|nr:NAD(P)/FAD-dependent oxidoreductase [Gammaproteobacteria bacterium]